MVITILSQYGFEENSAEKVFTFAQVICQLITNLHSCNNISKVIEEFKSNKKKRHISIYNKIRNKTIVPVLPGECVSPVFPPPAVQRQSWGGGCWEKQPGSAASQSFVPRQLCRRPRWNFLVLVFGGSGPTACSESLGNSQCKKTVCACWGKTSKTEYLMLTYRPIYIKKTPIKQTKPNQQTLTIAIKLCCNNKRHGPFLISSSKLLMVLA